MKEENIKKHANKCAQGKFIRSCPDYKTRPEIEEIPACDCDGYHTFDELYDHRITLYIAFCRKFFELLSADSFLNGVGGVFKNPIWRSKKHSDGELCFGTGTQYVLGIGKEKGKQITYHIPAERWEETNFAETLETAPEWDGHTSEDVLERIKNL